MKRTGLKVLAVLLPAFVVMRIGTRRDKWINAVLTCCLYVPGSIHALSVVCRKKRE